MKPLWRKNYDAIIIHRGTKLNINPILPGGGPLWPPLPWIHLPLSHGQGYVNQTSWLCSFQYLPGPRKPVLVFVFQKLKKLKVENFWGSSSIRRKSENFEIFYFLTNKPYFFKLNLNCTYSQPSFEVHNTLETQNFENFEFFDHNIDRNLPPYSN